MVVKKIVVHNVVGGCYVLSFVVVLALVRKFVEISDINTISKKGLVLIVVYISYVQSVDSVKKLEN